MNKINKLGEKKVLLILKSNIITNGIQLELIHSYLNQFVLEYCCRVSLVELS